MKINTLLLSLSAMGGLVHGLAADWSVVSTFDDDSALSLITDVASTVDSNARSEIVNGMWAAYPGDLFEANSNLYALLDLGVDLKAASDASQGPVTVYLEVMQPTVDDGAGGTRKAIVDVVWGISNEGPDTILDVRYDSYNAMQRINAGTDGYEGRNGGSYEATGEVFQADVVYSIWLVIDYSLGIYESYIQGGQWATQTRLDTAETAGFWGFRVDPGPDTVVEYMHVALSRGNSVAGEKGKDPMMFDNVYVDTDGQNLGKPGWTVVSTFDDDSALSLITDVASTVDSNARSEIVNGMWAAYPGDLFEANSNLYALLDLGVDLKAASDASQGPVTVYLEVMQPTVDDGAGGTRKAIVDVVWGISNEGPDTILDVRYDSYNAMQRINAGTDGYEGRNGGSYEATGEVFQADVVYSIWLVIDYSLGIYESYIQGGQWATQTRLDTAETAGFWGFRVDPGPDTVVEYMHVALSRGNSVAGEKGKDPMMFDNVAYDLSGMNLSAFSGGGAVVETPKGPGIFSDLDMVEDGWVNTGNFMGWVYTPNYPWVYLGAIGSWAFIDEGDGNGSTGKWAYVAR